MNKLGWQLHKIATPVAIVALMLAGNFAYGEGDDPVPPGLDPTALDRYINAPDSNYSYELVHYVDGPGYRAFVIGMTSQAWLTDDLIDRTLWKHWLTIVRPNEVTQDTGLLFIGGGSNNDPAPSTPSNRLVIMATSTGSVVSELGMVPNQPLTFHEEEPRGRYEDSLIAYTWDKFFQTGDEKWPLRLPMTKSAVRAMDTITDFLATEEGGEVKVDKFVVAGGSKRGWTTWTTAVVDDRVVAIIPLVIDMLNIEPSFIHHFKVYGKYARAIGDYEAENVMAWTGTPEYHALNKIVEPYEYRARLTMPKYMINSTGDQFFIPDSSQFYFQDLIGEKYLRYIPNTDHGLGGSDVGESLLAWYDAILNDVKRPRFSWSQEDDGSVRVKTVDKPIEVKLWRASNANARNFQKQTIGEAYASTTLREVSEGEYVGRVPVPDKGWTAFFVELTYASGTAVPFKFTTDVYVLPDVYPFEYKYSHWWDREPGYTEK